ncbi:MAG TPA: histidine triad nucleotide-binding protein [Methylophilaceae bacterium]|jgi:histidine triad (HIT) family protein|nr:histidine triad nucleotide-binding protein [Methylophilaceae bacterium]
MSDCIFCKIVAGDIPSKKVYEDEEFIAFHDIRPIAPVHFMLVPKLHVASLDECSESHRDLLGRLMLLAPKLAKEQGLEDGFRTMINTGPGGGQEVFHLHVHIFGGGSTLPKT